MDTTELKKLQNKIFDKVHDFTIKEAIFYKFIEGVNNPIFEDDIYRDKHLQVTKYTSKLRLINEKKEDNYFYVMIIVTANVPELFEDNFDKLCKDLWFDVDWCIDYKNMYADNISFFYETEDGKEELSELIEKMVEEEGIDVIAINKLKERIESTN